MRFVTYRVAGAERAGIAVGTAVVDAARALAHAELDGSAETTRELLALTNAQAAQLADAATECAAAGDATAADEVAFGPPVPDPDKIICLGLNYRAHAEEFQQTAPETPVLFPKFQPSLIGPRDTIRIPALAKQVDFEAELAIVIGRRCKNVSKDDAIEHIAGGMAFNDVTARDLQFGASQWTAGKAIDTFAPCGPALVSTDELGDVGALRLRSRVNGTLMQEASTVEMIFSVPEIVAYVSSLVTLVPGDIIATGTPEGVGFRRDPPVFLTEGDVVEIEIDGIGSLRNDVAGGGAT